MIFKSQSQELNVKNNTFCSIQNPYPYSLNLKLHRFKMKINLKFIKLNKTHNRSLNDDLREVNIFDNIKMQKAKTFDMDIVIWTKAQVLNNQRTREPVTILDIQLETRKDWILTNENDQKFKCTMDLRGTNPGTKVLKLLNELDNCKTLLNEIPFDDMLSEEKIVQLIKKVKN